MKILIINGSPRTDGDTVTLITELKKYLEGEIIELSAYYNNIFPCCDCRNCWQKKGCAIKDDMQIIYDDDFDNVVIAFPLYTSGFPGPLVNIANRLQAYYANKRFLKIDLNLKEKEAGLIIVGGGDGNPNKAIELAKWMFNKMNAHCNDVIMSLNTDLIPTNNDKKALLAVQQLAKTLNNKR